MTTTMGMTNFFSPLLPVEPRRRRPAFTHLAIATNSLVALAPQTMCFTSLASPADSAHASLVVAIIPGFTAFASNADFASVSTSTADSTAAIAYATNAAIAYATNAASRLATCAIAGGFTACFFRIYYRIQMVS